MIKLRKKYQISLFVAGCILINYIGKVVADTFMLPLWLDSIGTVLAAYVFGPVCGAIVGATVNVIYSLHSGIALLYGLTNIIVGVTVGICAKKDFFKHVFGVLSTAFLVTLLSVLVSAPLNYILQDGCSGNIWGDGVAAMLQELGWNKILSNVVGEFYLDFLDKVITLLLLFLFIQIFRRKKKSKTIRKKGFACLTIILTLTMLLSRNIVYAGEVSTNSDLNRYDFHKYVQTIYNGKMVCRVGHPMILPRRKTVFCGLEHMVVCTVIVEMIFNG